MEEDDEFLEVVNWQDLAACQGMPTEYFFKFYESDADVATIVDQACLSCPVISQCYNFATTGGEYGVWAGMYMNAGTPDKQRNTHKTKEVWKDLGKRLDLTK
jgi:hypothetical protein